MKPNINWPELELEEISLQLQTDLINGLTSNEVHKRLKKYGLNQLPEKKDHSTAKLLLIEQFSSFIVWILIVAVGILAVTGKWLDASVIGAIVILNALIGFIQEYKAEQALMSLRKLTIHTANVIREGTIIKLPSTEVVIGDLIQLSAGDQVPADGRIIYAVELETQESSLTGESVPVEKSALVIQKPSLQIHDKTNMVFMGTTVVKGNCKIIVTETATNTEIGKIATVLKATQKEITPLQHKLKKLGHQLVFISFGIVIIIAALGWYQEINPLTIILTSISLAIAAIPEGLPAVTTVALALGVKKMAKKNTLIRRLSSVETLGCTTVICSDKTGTLTKNEMTVKYIWLPEKVVSVSGKGFEPFGSLSIDNQDIKLGNHQDLTLALRIAILCNNAILTKVADKWNIIGSPTEGALLVCAAKAGVIKEKIESTYKAIREFPFDSTRKLMSSLKKINGKHVLFVKGSPETIISRARNIQVDSTAIPITESHKSKITEANSNFSQNALRVLAVAYRNIEEGELISGALENDLTFVGLFAMIDPPRAGVKEAIQNCKKAGIKIVMITGDQKETAIAIAKELNLVDNDSAQALDGSELDNIPQDKLTEKIRQTLVFARVSPEHKLKIVSALKKSGDIVAMTGDGVNDAPAIKKADIGIAMGISGTEVTKEASDMIILDDNFTTIVLAVEQGRGIYDNIVKFVNYLVSSNIAELLVIFSASLFGFKDPAGHPYISLLPIQLLWINLVTDGLPAVALGLDPINPRIMELPPRKPSEPILPKQMLAHMVGVSILIAAATLSTCHYGLQESAARGHTFAFNTLVALEFVRIQMIRSRYNIPILSNYWLIFAVIMSLVLQITITYVPAFQMIFGTVAISAFDWIIIFIAVGAVWGVNNIINLLIHKKKKKNGILHS